MEVSERLNIAEVEHAKRTTSFPKAAFPGVAP